MPLLPSVEVQRTHLQVHLQALDFNARPIRTRQPAVRVGLALGLGLGIGSAVIDDPSLGLAVELGLGVAIAEPGLGLADAIGVAVSLPHTLPAGTWQSAGATTRGSDGLTNTNESATETSDWMSPWLTGPASVIAAPPVVQPMTE